MVLLDINIVHASCFDDQWMLPLHFYHSPTISAFKIALLSLLKRAKKYQNKNQTQNQTTY